jgi:3',5'-cyclic AMP phosphodiesterase CpdA
MVNGYSINKEDINLQYANWKRSIEPYAHYFPVVAAMGNHEVLGHAFKNGKGRWLAFVPNFPFETASPSAVFASNFVNPHSDLISEDGAVYDPNPDKMDFPPYDETVFYYTYDNVAVIVLNSNYFYTPTIQKNSKTGGNLHGYLMDNQLKWLEKTLETLENDTAIDHIFISHHTPIFPNGGHVKDDMYYNGDNSVRPTIAGKPVDKGILERRDEYLDLIVNKSTKVVATMTGDEHNYNKVKITPDINIYPEDYSLPKLKRNRTLWQINNGSAGAPYYAQDRSTPWTEAVSGFTTQMALVLVYVEGKKVNVKVMNPDTLEIIDTYILRD